MNEKDLLAVALKHKLPMTYSYDHPWAYHEQVLAFGRDIAGEEWPEEHAFPPTPFPVTTHATLGNLFARFDLQMYAVAFEKRSRAAISEELGLHGADAGNPELILQAIKDMRIHAEHCALDSWWVKSLMEFWGNGAQDMDTRRAAKAACNMAAQVFAKNDLIGDAFEIVNKQIAATETFEECVKREFCITVEQAKRASFGIDKLREAFEQGQGSKACDCESGKVYSDAEPDGSPCPACTADPRDEFEKIFRKPSACERCGAGYTATAHGAWQAHEFINKWEGFRAALKLKAGE
ncbi:hypothetical protein PQR39_35420 [Paraburkholderia sediminicola]|uniref:hypothetical protein n=1 Tax=Paraburkholderia sediminicola TaxID=458836 RepID=UPI0038BB5BE3